MGKKKIKPPLLSIEQAAARGIARLRRPMWANPLDHVRIDLIGGGHGPWAHLHSPVNKPINGCDPVNILIGPAGINKLFIDPKSQEFVSYDGPAHDSEEYRQAALRAEEDWARFDNDPHIGA